MIEADFESLKAIHDVSPLLSPQPYNWGRYKDDPTCHFLLAEFREVGQQTGVGFAPKSGMSVAYGDIFNRGTYAVYVTNISEDGVLIQGNNLWFPKEGTAGESLTYENMARDLGVELGGWSFGSQFGDLNNDGNLDLYVTNGYVSLDRNRSYWYDFSKVASGNTTIIADGLAQLLKGEVPDNCVNPEVFK